MKALGRRGLFSRLIAAPVLAAMGTSRGATELGYVRRNLMMNNAGWHRVYRLRLRPASYCCMISTPWHPEAPPWAKIKQGCQPGRSRT